MSGFATDNPVVVALFDMITATLISATEALPDVTNQAILDALSALLAGQLFRSGADTTATLQRIVDALDEDSVVVYDSAKS